MDRSCRLNDLSDRVYKFEFSSDHHVQIEHEVQRLIDMMRGGSLHDVYEKNPDLEENLILWNMCSYPDFNNETELTERFSCVDPKPIIFHYNGQRKEQGKSLIAPEHHDTVNRLCDVIGELLPYITINKVDADPYVKKSARAFFPGNGHAPEFSVVDNLDYIVEQIESMTDPNVVTQLFRNIDYPHRYIDFDEETIRDLVGMAVKTYFARFEYNAAVNKEIIEHKNEMAMKLYGRPYETLSSTQRIVSELFVAYDWERDKREAWLQDGKRTQHYPDDPVCIGDYLDGGNEGLLFEITPSNVRSSEDLLNYMHTAKGFFGGKTLRVIPADEALKERNYSQFDDLPLYDALSNPEQFNGYAESAGRQYDSYKEKRPIWEVLPARG
jgi:hypothetical protein